MIIHSQNRGYGGNQKTCYDAALAARYGRRLVMLHRTTSTSATRIPELIAPIAAGQKDLMLGGRFLATPTPAGCPAGSTSGNRFLTGLPRTRPWAALSEYHTGLRAYSRALLEAIPYELNSDDFLVFDQGADWPGGVWPAACPSAKSAADAPYF